MRECVGEEEDEEDKKEKQEASPIMRTGTTRISGRAGGRERTLINLLEDDLDEEMLDLIQVVHDIYKRAGQRLLVLHVNVRLEQLDQRKILGAQELHQQDTSMLYKLNTKTILLSTTPL